MKSRTSSFNTTVFRKNLTRFAPAWGLYTLGMLLIFMVMAQDGSDYWFVAEMGASIQAMPAVGLCYGALVAQLLFGDLYNSRMCNALHALPLRREDWFFTNVVSGLVFNLIPTVVVTIFALPFSLNSMVENGWQVPLYWLLGANLSYLFFFGLAVLCVFFVGNRFAMAMVYGILNFAGMLVYGMVDTLYTPVIYGVKTWQEPFLWATPVVKLCGTEFLDVSRYNIGQHDYYADFALGEWWYMWLCAGLGVAMLVGAMALYRRRKLECAGDFMAIRILEPVFLVVYSLAVGIILYLFNELFDGSLGALFLILGVGVGYFTGRMLLKRRVRVFQLKAFAGYGAILAVLGISLAVTALDPLGIETWMPKAEEVRSVAVYFGHYDRNWTQNWNGEYFRVDTPEDIDQILKVHSLATREEAIRKYKGWEGNGITSGGIVSSYTIQYIMDDGSVVRRYYYAEEETEEMNILNPYFSSVECILGVKEENLAELADTVETVVLDGTDLMEYVSREEIGRMLEAMAADCREGHMAQRWSFHKEHVADKNDETFCYIEMEFEDGWTYTNIYSCCENTLAWLRENDLEQYTYNFENRD